MALVLSSISGSIQSSSRVGLTGSIIIANRPDNLFPSLPGDATLFVSGSSNADYAVFGGSVVGSGSLLLKNSSGATQFNAAASGITVSDSSGTSKFSVASSTGNTVVQGTLQSVGALTATGGLSGSLTKLTDGTSYLVAGSNIVVTTGSNGSITIAGTMNASTLVAGTDTQIQFNDGGSAFGGDAGLTYNKTTDTLTGVTGSFFTLSTSGNSTVGGGLTVTGASTLNGNVTVGDASADTVTVNGTTTFAGTSVTTTFAGNATVNGNTTLGDAAADTVTVNGTTTFAGAAVTTTFAGNTQVGGVLGVTGSAAFNGNVTLGDAAADTVTVNGRATFNQGISGSLTKLSDGTSYLIAGSNISIATGSNGAVTISTTADITDVTAGTGLTGGGSSGSLTLAINDSVVATVSGATFTGAVKVNSGLSGSHTKLTDGTSYIIAGTNMSVTTGSNGAITVTANAGGADTQVQFNDGSVFGGNANFTFTKASNLLKVANISGSITSSNVSAGQVVLAGTGGVLSGSNGLFWNNTSGSLGIGTTQPSGKLEVVGSSGSLFSVTDSMSGSLLSVNNSSGLPILEVLSDNRVVAGTSGANTLVVSGSRLAVGTTAIDTTKVLVSGSSTSSDKVLLVKAGVAGQTGALVDVQNSAGSSVFLVSNTGLSGSHTKLTDGTSAFIAGANVTITTGSSGAVTIAASMNAGSLVGGSDTQLQFNDAGSFGGDSGLTYNKTTDTLTGVTGSFFSLSTSGNSTVGGGLTVTGASTLNGNVTVGDASADTVTVNGTTTFAGASVTTTFAGNSQVGGALGVTGSAGFNGNVTLGDASGDTVTVNGTTTFAGSGVTTTFAGDVAVNGGDVTSSATTFNLLNSTVTTLNLGGAATAVEIGAATGTTSINNSLTVDGNTTLGDAAADTVTVNGTTTFAGAAVTTTFAGNSQVGGALGVTGSAGFNGSVTLGDASADTVTVNGTTTFAGASVTTTFAGNTTVSGISQVGGALGVTGSAGFNGNVTLGDAAADTVTVNGTTTFAGASVTTTFAGNSQVGGILGVTGSASFNGNVTLGDAAADTVTVNGRATFNQGLSGSLTKLSDGSSYLIAGNNISIATGSNGAVTISTQADITDVTAGTGLTGGGSSGNVTLGINDSIVATVSGTTFTGAVKFNAGLSGSLTKLTDGSSAFVAGNNVTITTGSNGSVTIAASMNAGSLVAGVDTQIQFNDGGTAFGGDAGLTYNKTTDTLTGVTGSFFTLSTSGNSTVGGGLTVTGAATLNGNVTVGDASADTVTVNGTTTFAGAGVTTTFAGNSQVGGALGVTGSAGFNGNVTLGDASADTVTVNGTTTFAGAAVTTTFVGNATVNGNTTLGDAAADTVTVNGTTTFAGASVTTTFAGNSQVGGVLGVTGSAGFNGNVTLGDASGDTVTVNGTTTFAGSGVTTTFAGDVAVNGGDVTSSATTFNLLNSTVTTLNIGGAATAVEIGATTGTTSINNDLTVDGNVTLGNANTDTVTFTSKVNSNILPSADVTYSLGSSTNRWANIYTGDLHLKNERGDYTLIEEEDFLTIRFNKTGKRYKFMLEAVPELDEELGNFSSGPKPSV